MKESILKNKMILAVDDDPDVLIVLEEEILAACPDCQFHGVATYQEAVERMASLTYDLVLLDIVGVRGFDLAKLAERRNFPVALLTIYPLTTQAIKNFFKIKAYAYLPKERMGEIVPFLEETLRYQCLPGWKHLLGKVTGFLGNKIEIDWGKKPVLSRQAWVLSKVGSA
jgi:DNA-binding NtrC family response regulator